jgi:hypothetical protein
MSAPVEQRQAERLSVPRHCRAAGRGARAVELLDLSPAGARIAHGEPLRDWSDLAVDLPLALGGGQLRATVVWSRVAGQSAGDRGRAGLMYQSGLAFPPSSPAEQAALTVALVRLAGEWALNLLRDLRRQAKGVPTQQETFDALCAETLGWLGREIEGLRFPLTP